LTSGFTRFFKSLFCAVQHYVNVRVVSYFETVFCLICGCKGTAFFLSCKFFRNFFWKFFV